MLDYSHRQAVPNGSLSSSIYTYLEMPCRQHFRVGHQCSCGRSLLWAVVCLPCLVFWPTAILHVVHQGYRCVSCGKTADLSPGYVGRGPLSDEVWRCRECWVDFYAHGLEVAPRKGARVFALGPSHFERKALTAAGFPWQEVGDGNILQLGQMVSSTSWEWRHYLFTIRSRCIFCGGLMVPTTR